MVSPVLEGCKREFSEFLLKLGFWQLNSQWLGMGWWLVDAVVWGE
jgi:hypothetical protein